MRLYGGAIGGLAHPYIEVLALPRFEEQDIIAVVEFGQFVELVELGLGIKLCIFSAVRQEGVEIIKEMSVSVGYPTRGEDEDPLLSAFGNGGSGRWV